MKFKLYSAAAIENLVACICPKFLAIFLNRYKHSFNSVTTTTIENHELRFKPITTLGPSRMGYFSRQVYVYK